ncbi:ankyrin repeat-containing protein, partial [Trifolium pratense]
GIAAIVYLKCREAKNAEGKKPREIFFESHKELIKEGEKWAKETAGSFTLVATLITTIMFAAAFTVPGGNNQDSGIPILLQDKIFNLFIIADAISLFMSSTSILLFIGILTSRFGETDFLKSLPLKLLFGLITLFFSVVSMMVAFCASLAMLLKGHLGVIITTMSLASLGVGTVCWCGFPACLCHDAVIVKFGFVVAAAASEYRSASESAWLLVSCAILKFILQVFI